MFSRWTRVASCLIVSASLASAAPQRATGKPAPAPKNPTGEKAKPAEPKKRELADQNVSFETPDDWKEAGSGGCHGGFVLALNLPVKPVKVNTPKPGEKIVVPPAGYASMFTFVVNPQDVDGSSLDAAVESLEAQIKKTYEDATFTPAKDAKVGGESGKQFVATFKQAAPDGSPAIPKRQQILLTRRGEKTYRFALEASAPNYEKDRPAMDKLVRTVAWLDAAGAGDAKTISGAPSSYKSAEHGLQLQMPAGWHDGQSSMPGSIAVFLPPEGSDSMVRLFTRDPQGKDADAILTTLHGEIRSHDANAKIDPLEDSTLGGEPARSSTYRVTLGGEERSSLMIASIHAGKAYVVGYSAKASVYEKDLATVKRMIDSFKWTTQGKTPATRPAAH